jgi:protein phosphatase
VGPAWSATAAYRFRDGLEQLRWSPVVGEMIRSGVLAREEAESHPRRNELIRAIGPLASVDAETLVLRHMPGDRFLLCTDGLWGSVPAAEIEAVLGSQAPPLAVKKLVAQANERGGPDNVTVQIAIVEAGATEETAEAGERTARTGLGVAIAAAAVLAALIAFALLG